MRPNPKSQWIEARFVFRVPHGDLAMECDGVMRLVPDAETREWRLWLLVTALKNVDGWGDVDNLDPVMTKANGADATHANGHSRANGDAHELSMAENGRKRIPVAIVGAGFSGLCMAGRLEALGVPYVMLDKVDEIGGNWTCRYPSVRIHTSKEYGQFPFETRVWGDETQYHLSPDDLERGYKEFAKIYDIKFQPSTMVHRAIWSDKTTTWTLQLERKGKKETLECEHLILALGGGGQIPVSPPLANRDKFKGVVLHTNNYTTSEKWRGLRGAVIGSANSAHDVCSDMLDAGASSVTMIQRGRTPVLPSDTYRVFTDRTYNKQIPIAVSDLLNFATPNSIGRQLALGGISAAAARGPERFDALELAGFRVERNMDLYACLYERYGGHYLDVGASRKVADGLIKVRAAPPGRGVVGFYDDGLVFEDGGRLPADVVVLATGFEVNMREQAAAIVGPEVADKMDDWWCVDGEGEIRGGWKYIGRELPQNDGLPLYFADDCVDPGLWMTGGNIGLSRYFSRFLGLQIKAQLEGVPFKAYNETRE